MNIMGKFKVPEDEYVIKQANVSATIKDTEEYASSTFIADIPCENIIIDNENSIIYGDETEKTLAELANDIKRNGFKGAIIAYPVTNNTDNRELFQIESGHRRFLAAKMAGLDVVPVIITEKPKSEAERRIRLISMNLHARNSLKPTVVANIINTLLSANKEEQQRQHLPYDMATLMEIVSSQMELSVKSLEKYRQFDKLHPELKEIADEGISWSALAQSSALPDDIQKTIASAIWKEIGRVGVDNVSRQWILSLIARVKQELSGQTVKPKTVVKRRDGGKIIAKAAKDFDDIINGNAIFKGEDRENTLKNLVKIKECIDKKIEELSN